MPGFVKRMAARGWRVAAVICAMQLTVSAAPALAAGVTDCPLAKAAYSIDSPLIDVLMNPSAKAIMTQELGESFVKLPAFFSSTQAPSFAAIVSPRSVGKTLGWDEAALLRAAPRLAAVPVTPADVVARCARYDNDPVTDLTPSAGKPRVLVFEKMTGFVDLPSVQAAHTTLRDLASRSGWSLQFTDKGGAMRPDILKRYDVVIWNNVSGDVLTLPQRAAFRRFIENGGGFVGIHGSAGDPVTFWDWYTDTLVGARFLGHPMKPQLRPATIRFERPEVAKAAQVPVSFEMTDEWYSFRKNPRANGSTIIATLDERTYAPPENLVMGADHPIIWRRCIGKGRAFYSAIGHSPETYVDARYRNILVGAVEWSAAKRQQCR